VTVERLLEGCQGDHEPCPAVPKTDLDDVTLESAPERMSERGPHRHLAGRQLAGAERGIRVRLLDQLVEVSKREMQKIVLQRACPAIAQHLAYLIRYRGRVAHATLAEELQPPIIRIPPGALDPAAHQVIAAGNAISIVSRLRAEQFQDLVAQR